MKERLYFYSLYNQSWELQCVPCWYWFTHFSPCPSVFIFFQLYGENATTPFITAACPFGWSRTIVVPSASRTGWFRELANKLRLLAVWFSTDVLHLYAPESGDGLDCDHCNVPCRASWDGQLPSYLWLHARVVLVSKVEMDKIKAAPTRRSQTRWCGRWSH